MSPITCDSLAGGNARLESIRSAKCPGAKGCSGPDGTGCRGGLPVRPRSRRARTPGRRGFGQRRGVRTDRKSRIRRGPGRDTRHARTPPARPTGRWLRTSVLRPRGSPRPSCWWRGEHGNITLQVASCGANRRCHRGRAQSCPAHEDKEQQQHQAHRGRHPGRRGNERRPPRSPESDCGHARRPAVPRNRNVTRNRNVMLPRRRRNRRAMVPRRPLGRE